jgi:hypothetical protein
MGGCLLFFVAFGCEDEEGKQEEETLVPQSRVNGATRVRLDELYISRV